tara:strand:+ start:456 stop:893 length:438 start_codon:yes stop_codon:yes gene_type:complete
MRLVIQKVKEATVNIDNKKYSYIKSGLLCFVAFCDHDLEDDLSWAINKLLKLKLFNNNGSIQNMGLELLIVSQFTLFANIKKGTKPSWVKAAKPGFAKKLYALFINLLKDKHPGKIKTGVFGADMKVQLINDGPVTLIIDTKNKQ